MLGSTASLEFLSVGTTYLIRVGGFNASFGNGTLLVSESVVVSPCDTPDALEVNTDCASATPLVDGTYPDLNVETDDNDYYAVTVPAGGTLSVDIFFADADGDVDLYLWDPLVECDTNVAGTGGAFLVRGFSASDNESIVWDNVSGMDQDLIIEIDMFNIPGCNAYDMTILGSGVGDGGIGSAYCMAVANSTGVPGSMLLTGSNVVADNDVTAVASNLPMESFGFLITSLTQGFNVNPGGSSGNLCLGGAIGRNISPGQVMNSGMAGQISLSFDLTMIPTPTGFVSASVGDNWNYQLWYRDMSPTGATSNFTEGYSVTYE